MNKYYVMPADIIESNFPEDNLSKFPVIFMKKEKVKNADEGILEHMGHYLSNDEMELPKILRALRNAKDASKPLEYIRGISVWEPLEHKFTIAEFCDMCNI